MENSNINPVDLLIEKSRSLHNTNNYEYNNKRFREWAMAH